MNTETLDRLYLEWSQFTRAITKRELDLLAVLERADKAINPPDRSGISMDEWNKRLKAITADIRLALAQNGPYASAKRDDQ